MVGSVDFPRDSGANTNAGSYTAENAGKLDGVQGADFEVCIAIEFDKFDCRAEKDAADFFASATRCAGSP